MSRIREKKAPPAANIEALLALGRSATTGQFAKTVRSTSDTTFRALSWSDVAVPLADQPPVPVEDTPEGETTTDPEDTNETELFVKVAKNWRTNDRQLQRFGYSSSQKG